MQFGSGVGTRFMGSQSSYGGPYMMSNNQLYHWLFILL